MKPAEIERTRLVGVAGASDREFGPRGKWPRLVELSDAMK